MIDRQVLSELKLKGMMFLVAVLLILAWKVTWYIGLDRYLLSLLGTPWRGQPAAASPAPANA